MTKKISFITLGCKTNHYDTDVMARECMKAGFDVAVGDADVYVINTCAVTSAADAQARNMVRSTIRKNPRAVVIVCGCSSQVDPERHKGIEGVDHVLGVRAAEALVPLLCKEGLGEVDCGLPHPSSPYKGEEIFQPRARAFLKIQDGCNNRCAYCIVPFARGESKSIPPDDVQKEAASLSQAGYRETILTGVHVGRYGKDLNPQTSLHDLLKNIINETKGCRIRISSLDPDEVGDELIRLLVDPRICRHLHLSLQSGSDEVLKMMNRREGKHGEMIHAITERIPGIAVGADIITGFPGETDEHFDQTLRFVEEMPFAYLHVFPYSARPGTKAHSLPNQIPADIKKRRAKKLLEISAEKRKAFYESQIGKCLDVIIVSKEADGKGLVKGISDNYVPIILSGDQFEYREIYNVEVCSINSWRRGKGVRGYLGGPDINGYDAVGAES